MTGLQPFSPTFKGAYIPAHKLPYASESGYSIIDLILTGKDAVDNSQLINEDGETSIVVISYEDKDKEPKIYYRKGWKAKETPVTTQEGFVLVKKLYNLAHKAKTNPDRENQTKFDLVMHKISRALLDFAAAKQFKI